MGEYKKEIQQADLIYLNAPGLNKMFFIAEGKPLNSIKDRIRNIQFSMKKANYTEITEAYEILTTMRLDFDNCE